MNERRKQRPIEEQIEHLASQLRFEIETLEVLVKLPPGVDPCDPDIDPSEFIPYPTPKSLTQCKKAQEALWELANNDPGTLPTILTVLLQDERLTNADVDVGNLHGPLIKTFEGFGQKAIPILEEMDSVVAHKLALRIGSATWAGELVERVVKRGMDRRTERFLSMIQKDIEGYQMDYEMKRERRSLYCEWLEQIAEGVQTLSKELTIKETQALLAVVEELYPKQYYTAGTGYGTACGARPVLEIIRCLKQEVPWLEEDETVAYLSALGVIYDALGPKYDHDGQIHDEVATLNHTISKSHPDERLGIIKRAKESAERRRKLRLRGINLQEHLHARNILALAGFEYDPDYPRPSLPQEKKEVFNAILELIPEKERAVLIKSLERKTEAVKDNYSDYRAPGLSETTLNTELDAIWREVERLFYSVLDKYI